MLPKNKQTITSGSRHLINANKNVGRSSLTGHITVCAKPFVVVLARKFSTHKPIIKIPVGLRLLIENSVFQLVVLLLLLGSYYIYVFGVSLVVPVFGIHLMFFLFLGVHFFFIKPLSFHNEKSGRGFSLFSAIYCLFSLVLAIYLESFFRLFIIIVFLVFLVYKILPPTDPIREKLLPVFAITFIESSIRDEKTLEKHVREDLPFLFTVRTAFRLQSLLLYGVFVMWSIDPSFLKLTGEFVGYLVFSNSLTLLFILAFTQYILCCCNTPPENFIISTAKLAFFGGVSFIAGQIALGSHEETSHIALLPASAKYCQQDFLKGSILVDPVDRQVRQIQKDLTAAGIIIPYTDSKDPYYPMRYDGKAYIDAMTAYNNNASSEEIEKILTRNSKLAAATEEINSYKPFWEILTERVPKRRNMLESCAESNARALRNAPDPTGNYYSSVTRWKKKS